MKLNFLKWLCVAGAMSVAACVASAQETNEVEQLRKEMREMRERMRQMEQKLESLEQNPPTAAPPAANPAIPPATEPATAPATPWSPSQPLTIARAGSAYMNISFDGLFAAGGSTARDIDGGTQLGGHDPKQRGFTVG